MINQVISYGWPVYLSGFLGMFRSILHVVDELVVLSHPFLQLLLFVHPRQVVLGERLDDGGAVGVAEHVVGGAATVSAIH